MNISELNSLIVILLFGAFILLSFLIIINPIGVNRKANFWFGIFLFLWSTFWLDEIVLLVGSNEINTFLNLGVHFIQFFTPIIFYLSVIYFTNPNYKFKSSDLKYLFLPIVYLIVLLLQLTYYKEDSILFQLILIGLILVQIVYYVSASYLKIRQHQKRIQLFSSNTIEIDLNWLEYIIYLIFLVGIITIFYNLFYSLLPLNIFMNIFFLIVVYFIAYYSLKQKEIYPLDENQRIEIISINEVEEMTKTKRKLISDGELMNLKSDLAYLMRDQKPYLDSELNLIKLAELLNISPHQLSYVINSGFNENFYQFVNRHRIEKAKQLLLKEEMSNLSILGIAFESGFNSKTSFYTTFKKIEGTTPSEFKKSSLL